MSSRSDWLTAGIAGAIELPFHVAALEQAQHRETLTRQTAEPSRVVDVGVGPGDARE